MTGALDWLVVGWSGTEHCAEQHQDELQRRCNHHGEREQRCDIAAVRMLTNAWTVSAVS